MSPDALPDQRVRVQIAIDLQNRVLELAREAHDLRVPDEEALQRATRAVKAARMGRASNRATVLAVLAALDRAPASDDNDLTTNEDDR